MVNEKRGLEGSREDKGKKISKRPKARKEEQ